MDYSVHCNKCQSYPDGYICGHMGMTYPGNEEHKVGFRWCPYQYIDPRKWQLDKTFDFMVHPCPFFTGEVRYHKGREVEYVLRVDKPNGRMYKDEYKGY